MKIRRVLLVMSVLVLVLNLGFVGRVKASGSGAGTQSTTETLDALDDVDAATSVAQVRTAVQDFLDQYSVTASTSALAADNWHGTALASGDFTNVQLFATEFIQEWSKFTVDFVTASHLQTVYMITNLLFDFGNIHVCANFGTTANFMAFDVSCEYEGSLTMRGAFAHEYSHYFITKKVADSNHAYYDADTWKSYNPAGFQYGSGGASVLNDPTFVNTFHPSTGFVTNYAKTAIEEDQADVDAFLFQTNLYPQLKTWIQTDSNLAQKVARAKTFLRSIDPTMDDAYFEAIHDYAVDQLAADYGSLFSGAGYQYTMTDGSGTLVWVLPAGATGHGGVGIGSVSTPLPYKHIFVMDGTMIAGSSQPIIEVGAGGILIGTGSAPTEIIQIDAGGILAPGHSPGCMTGGDLIIAGTYKAEIGGATACNEYDQMKVTGTVDLTGGTLSASLYNNYIPKAGESYTIIDNDGTDMVTGTFNSLPEGSTFTLGSTVLRISYKGGTGNDVVLSVVSSPTATVSAPNTGFKLISNNSWVVLLATSLAAGAVLAVRARYNKTLSKK